MHYEPRPNTERERAAEQVWREVSNCSQPGLRESEREAVFRLTDGHDKRMSAACLNDLATIIHGARECGLLSTNTDEQLKSAVNELAQSLRDIVARLRADGEWVLLRDGHAQDLMHAQLMLEKHAAKMTSIQADAPLSN